MDLTPFYFPSVMETQQGYNLPYLDDQFGSLAEGPTLLYDCPPPPLDPLCNSSLLPIVPYSQTNHIFQGNDFRDFEDISEELSYWDSCFSSYYGNPEVDLNPQDATTKALLPCEDVKVYGNAPVCVAMPISEVPMNDVRGQVVFSSRYDEKENVKARRAKTSSNLELDEIKKHFNVPITKAAKKMNVGLTILKKRCRELNIMRWPHRKLKSLEALINSVKELGMSDEVMKLEEHKRLMERIPDLELSEETKKLRQACFKANYKKRKSFAAAHGHHNY